MKLFTRIKLFGKKAIEDLMPIDNITQLEKMMNKLLDKVDFIWYNTYANNILKEEIKCSM